MTKVGIISTVGVPACYGGYESLVENLLHFKQTPDIQYVVYCSSKAYKQRKKEYLGAQLVYLPFYANGWQSILYDSFSLIHAFFTCDVVLSLGTVGCWLLPILKIFSGKKRIVINYDGLDHKRAKWSSFPSLILAFTRKCAGWFSDDGIADNAALQSYIKLQYGRETVLIEYGGDNAKPVTDDHRLARYGLKPQNYIFNVARIEPENNIRMLLEAALQLPDEIFVIVGNWNKSEWGRMLRGEFSACKNIQMLDPIYDAEHINLLRSNCKIYLHGHSMGGTNPSLVEAMNLHLPIFAYDVIYNRTTTEDKAFYFSSTNQLVNLIKNTTPSQLKQIADSLWKIARCRYTWSVIVQKYEQLLLNTVSRDSHLRNN